jgi:segregation and condensation protein B
MQGLPSATIGDESGTMSLKAQIEAVIYAAEEPVGLEHIAAVLRNSTNSEELSVSAIEAALDELRKEYESSERGMEIRQVANGYRMATKPEHHDVVRAFAKSLKPPVRLSLPALETLAVIAYRQPVTAPEISEIRGVDCAGVLATLLDRKLITTAGRKAVVGRPILYRTTKDFLLRFGLNDVTELPSIEEFEKLMGEVPQPGLFESPAVPDATGVAHLNEETPVPVEPAEGEPYAAPAVTAQPV